MMRSPCVPAMTELSHRRSYVPIRSVAGLLLGLASASTLAQQTIADTPAQQTAPNNMAQQATPVLPNTPTADAVVNLIQLMVKKNLLSETEAQSLLTQAQTEAAQVQQAQIQAAEAAAATVALKETQGDQHIRYVPDAVRDEMVADAKTEVLAEVEEEGWAKPGVLPPWIDTIAFEGDVRLRDQAQNYAGDNSDQIIDFATLNATGPFDVNFRTNLRNPPFLNTRQDRNSARVRARFGLRATISEQWEAGLRIATGNDRSPVSTNQTFGGGLSKKDLWLDRAYLTWKPLYWLTLTGGRTRNPYWSTPTLYDEDLNFDGAAALFDVPLNAATALRLFGTLGATALEFTTENFPSTSPDKAGNENKWLFGGQFGVDWSINERNRLRSALAYYSFNNIRGKLSEPCALYLNPGDCSTDWSRPAFMQRGNTLMLLRNIVLDPANPDTTQQPQFVGSVSKFNLADINLRYDTRLHDLDMSIEGDYIRNLSYDENAMVLRSGGGIVNNLDVNSELDSGDTAWQLQATFGKSEPVKPGDWNALVGYRRIEPDALPDAYNDSDFHLGGTNAKGYYLGGAYGLDRNIWIAGRWFSAKEVFGEPLSIDLLQIDLNARF